MKRLKKFNEDFILSKNEKEEIENVLIDLFDDFRYLNFKIYNFPEGENKENLLVIQSDINVFPFRKYLEAEREVGRYLMDSECVDRMVDLGYKYLDTRHDGHVINIFFQKK